MAYPHMPFRLHMESQSLDFLNQGRFGEPGLYISIGSD
jgi:hypothetical protein